MNYEEDETVKVTCTENGNVANGVIVHHHPNGNKTIVVEKTIKNLMPNIFINLAAITDVDYCEKNREIDIQQFLKDKKIICKKCANKISHVKDNNNGILPTSYQHQPTYKEKTVYTGIFN